MSAGSSEAEVTGESERFGSKTRREKSAISQIVARDQRKTPATGRTAAAARATIPGDACRGSSAAASAGASPVSMVQA